MAEGQPYTLRYGLTIARDSFPLSLRCGLAGGRRLDLTRSGDGGWTGAGGQFSHQLHGCTDIDLRVGESRELRAVWTDVPSLEVRATRQRYTRTDEDTCRYENLETGYSNELTVDSLGPVTLYPRAFERLA